MATQHPAAWVARALACTLWSSCAATACGADDPEVRGDAGTAADAAADGDVGRQLDSAGSITVDVIEPDQGLRDSGPEDAAVQRPDAMLTEAEVLARRICAEGERCGGYDECTFVPGAHCEEQVRFRMSYAGCCGLYHTTLDGCIDEFTSAINRLRRNCGRGLVPACQDEQACLMWAANPRCEPVGDYRLIIAPEACTQPFAIPDCRCED